MNAILDTGPWVALIDRSESKHDICVQWLKSYSGKLYLQTQKSAICHYALTKHNSQVEFVKNEDPVFLLKSMLTPNENR